jgi:dTDP-4-amino-4,6-dideoxygalactose transaminase
VITTDDEKAATAIRHWRGQGMTERLYYHDCISTNARLTELQGAVACAQLEHIDEFVRRREVIMARYRANLAELIFQQNRGSWAFAVTLPKKVNREWAMAALLSAGIDTRPVFYDISTMPPYNALKSGPHRVARFLSAHGIVLPVYPDLSDNEVDFVSQNVLEVARDRSRHIALA